MAAPAAQRAAVAGDLAAQLGGAGKAEAVLGRGAVGEGDRGGEAVVERVGVVARGVDLAFPGDHVVEAGAEPGIAGPQDAVLRGAEATGRRALVALGAVGHGGCVGGEQRGCHAGGIEDAGAQQVGEAAAGAVLQDVGQQTKILVDVGVAGAGGEVQRARAGDDAGGLGVAERRFGRRAVQHRHRPVVAQAGLVVAQVQRAWWGLLQVRQAGAHVGVQHRGVGEGVQHGGAGELLGDRAHAEQCPRGEGDAALGVGPAPGVADQRLAGAQDAAWPGIGTREGLQGAVEAGGEGAGHGRHCRAAGCGA